MLELDGFPEEFLRRNWSSVKADFLKGVRSFFESDRLFKNTTFTALVPKSPFVDSMDQVQTISLHNFIY